MLYSPMKLKGLELKNRWVMLAMHNGYTTDNIISEREIAFYEARAKGGAAAITVVMGVNTDGALKGMLNAETMQDWSGIERLAQILHQYDCKLFVQLFHCGRNERARDRDNRPVLAPSAVASTIFKNMPKEMTEQDMKDTLEAYEEAAKKCKACGADVIEVNISAGYLLSQFLSPIDNLRQDNYGGSLENRMRFPLEVLERVRFALTEDFPISVKLSGAQMITGGYSIEDMKLFSKELEKRKLADVIAVTGGWHESPVEQISYHVPKGGYAFLAEAIKSAVSLPIIACNRISDGETAEEMLEKGICDLVGSARGFLCDAEFADRIQKNVPFNVCQACNKCIQRILKGEELACAYNPEAGNEYIENSHRKIATKKKVLVVGGGPGGMMAAKKAADRGFQTTLCTKENKLGGQLNLAMLPPGKGDISKFIEYMEYELRMAGVKLLFNTEVDADFIMEFDPYFVVVATGSIPQKPDIPGIDGENVYLAKEVFEGDNELFARLRKGKTVIIGGGSLGLEIAGFLVEQTTFSNEVERFAKSALEDTKSGKLERIDLHILEQSPFLGTELGSMSRPVLNELDKNDVKMTTEVSVQGIYSNCVLVERNGKLMEIPADHVIIAMGSVPADTNFVVKLQDERISYALIGDANMVGDAMTAIYSAYELFLRMYIA